MTFVKKQKKTNTLWPHPIPAFQLKCVCSTYSAMLLCLHQVAFNIFTNKIWAHAAFTSDQNPGCLSQCVILCTWPALQGLSPDLHSSLYPKGVEYGVQKKRDVIFWPVPHRSFVLYGCSWALKNYFVRWQWNRTYYTRALPGLLLAVRLFLQPQSLWIKPNITLCFSTVCQWLMNNFFLPSFTLYQYCTDFCTYHLLRNPQVDQLQNDLFFI